MLSTEVAAAILAIPAKPFHISAPSNPVRAVPNPVQRSSKVQMSTAHASMSTQHVFFFHRSWNHHL
jgi:hypothetical protein